MKNVALSRLALPLGIICLAMTASCRSPISGFSGPTGVLTITLPSGAGARDPGAVEASARSLAAHAGTIATWRLEGAGPQGRTYEGEFSAAQVTSSGNKVTIELALGDWTITIRGLDTDGAVTFTATQAVTVKADEPATCAMTLAWAEKALVARLSFDQAIQDDRGRLTAAPSVSSWVPTASTPSLPSLDGEKYLAFTATNYIDLSAIELGEQFSVSMWIQVSGTSDMVLVSSRHSATGDGFTLYRGGSGTIRVETKNGSHLETGNVVTASNSWYHVAFAMNTITGRVSIFVNGIIQASAEVQPISANLPLRLGGSFYEPYPFIGGMDDVRVYVGTLSADEIAAIHADGYFSGGLGTAASPYLVATPMDLYNIRYFPSAYFSQTEDIDLRENEWKPIPSLKGSYNGGNKTISNLALNDGVAYVGLFEELSLNSKVVDLIIDGASGNEIKKTAGALAGSMVGANVENIIIKNISLRTIASNTRLGGLIGRIDNTSASLIKSITIEEIKLNGRVQTGGLIGYIEKKAAQLITIDGVNASKVEILTDTSYSGGLIGQTAYPTIIKNSKISGKVSSLLNNPQYIGGFVGYLIGATIENCSANVIVGEGNGFTESRQLGGFAGQLEGPSTLTNCHATGAVHGHNTSTTLASNTGGFVGRIYATSDTPVLIVDCSASGNVTVIDGDNVGGFAGSVDSSTRISGSSASGYVSAAISKNVGGFVGDITITDTTRVTTSRASGAVTAAEHAGGFIGHGKGTSGKLVEISECLSSGSVTATSRVGGFAGFLEGFTKIEDSYTWSMVNADSVSVGGFIGYVTPSTELTVSRCYAAATLQRIGITGGFVGLCDYTLPVVSCYWDLTKSGKTQDASNVSGSAGLTTAEMWTPYNFIQHGWGSAWTIIEGFYPTLAWEHETP